MSLSKPISKLVENITWETIEGRVQWSFADAPSALTSGTPYIIPIYVTTKYKDYQRVSVYERRFKYYTDEDSWSWTSMIVFVMIDNWGRVIFESEDSDLKINSLFNVARDNASKVDDIVKKLLGDE